MNLESSLLTPRAGWWLQHAYVPGVLRRRGHAVLRHRRGCGSSRTKSVAVTCVVAQTLADALQGLVPNLPRRRRSARRPSVNDQ